MKHNRGRFRTVTVCALWLPLILLGAEDFRFNLQANTRTPYLKAPVHITVDLNQTNHNVVLLYRFALKPSNDYKAVQIDGIHDDTLYHAHHRYLYELYPLKTGDVNVTFEMVKRVTDEQKVAYSASGDRDDFKKLQTKDTAVSLPPLRLRVKPLPPQTTLIGRYTLTHTFARTQAEAYAPIPIKIVIRGKGYPPRLDTILPSIKGVKVFAEEPEIKRSLSSEGIIYEATYTLALSAAKSFTLPKTILHAFDPESHTPYTLTIPQQRFKITSPGIATLVDKVDTPPPLQTKEGGLLPWLGYLFAFMAGFMSANFVRFRTRGTSRTPHPLHQRIDRCKDKRALLRLLMAHDAQHFSPVIDVLESDLYANGAHSLRQLKQQAKELLS